MKPISVCARATIVVPTRNEASNIEALVRRIGAAVPDAEILFVDDGSTDGTAAGARELATHHPVRVLERSGERDLSTAVLLGFQEARTDLCLVMDADLSHPPEAIPLLVRAVEEGADIAIGSRYVRGGDVEGWSFVRRLVSAMGTWITRPLTRVRDPLAGFFCLRRGLLRDVELKPRGFKILLEILARANPRRVVEIPIRFDDRSAGESKFDSRRRKEFLKQVAILYRDGNAWPWRLVKFLATGALGYGVHLFVLCGLVEGAGARPVAAAVAGFSAAVLFNYALNRVWTFQARRTPLPSSLGKYLLGALGGLGIQLGVMTVLSSFHYGVSASLGILGGTLFTFAASQFWAFAGRPDPCRNEDAAIQER